MTTTLIDALPYPSATPDVSPLSVGSWLVFVNYPAVTTNSCVATDAHEITWQCSPKSMLNLTVTQRPSGDQFVSFTAEYLEKNNAPLRYGAQAPRMRGPASVSLMQDATEMESGPAWFFQQLFDKLVILKASDVSPSFFPSTNKRLKPNNSRRDQDTEAEIGWLSGVSLDEDLPDDVETYLEERGSLSLDVNFEDLAARGAQQKQDQVLTGDHLWYCFWNKTIIEGFIYANLTPPPNSADLSVVQSIASSTLVSDAPLSAATALASSDSWPSTPPMYQGPPRDRPMPTLFPYLLKLEERRGSNMPQPTCQKMVANADGSITPAAEDDGPTFFTVTEQQIVPQKSLRLPGASNSKRWSPPQYKDLDRSCKCIWQSPSG